MLGGTVGKPLWILLCILSSDQFVLLLDFVPTNFYNFSLFFISGWTQKPEIQWRSYTFEKNHQGIDQHSGRASWLWAAPRVCSCGIVQMLTNNPGSVESAGWGLACEWWKVGNESPAKRFEILCESAEAIGKHHLKETVREMIRDKVAQSDEMEEVPQDSPSNAGMGTRLKQSDRDLFCWCAEISHFANCCLIYF